MPSSFFAFEMTIFSRVGERFRNLDKQASLLTFSGNELLLALDIGREKPESLW